MNNQITYTDSFNAHSFSFLFLGLSLFLVFLKSLHAWITWSLNIVIANTIGILAFLLFWAHNPASFKFSGKNILLCFLFFIVRLYSIKNGNLNGFIGAIIATILISFLICIKDEYKIDILNFITKAFAALLSISIVGWILFLIGVPIPYYSTNFNEGQYFFNNHYLFLFNLKSLPLVIPRFSSIFLEPGHLGMITSFLLFIHQYNLKKIEILIIFIATVLSFSLVAYILTLAGISLLLLTKSKKAVFHIIFWFIILLIGYHFFTTYNKGNNPINALIIERLKFEDGTISGNNRFTEYLDNYYTKFIESEKKYFGIGSKRYNQIDWGGGNAGYKQFIIEHGIIGVFLVFIFYLAITLRYKNNLSYFLLIIYFLCFLQASYALWECELFIFITALPYLKTNKLR